MRLSRGHCSGRTCVQIDARSGLQDELVPFEHMQHINNLAVTKHKVWAECPNSGHMDAYEADAVFYWQTVKSFWAQFVQA